METISPRRSHRSPAISRAGYGLLPTCLCRPLPLHGVRLRPREQTPTSASAPRALHARVRAALGGMRLCCDQHNAQSCQAGRLRARFLVGPGSSHTIRLPARGALQTQGALQTRSAPCAECIHAQLQATTSPYNQNHVPSPSRPPMGALGPPAPPARALAATLLPCGYENSTQRRGFYSTSFLCIASAKIEKIFRCSSYQRIQSLTTDDLALLQRPGGTEIEKTCCLQSNVS